MLAGVAAGVAADVAADVAGGMAAGVIAFVQADAALGVSLRLEVLDFDLFLTFCWHFIFLSGWFVLCQWHRRAIDARL